MTTLSKAITGRREKLGMTQHDLAEAIGISHRKASQAFGIDPDVIEILSGHVPADLMRKWQNDPERAAKWMREGFFCYICNRLETECLVCSRCLTVECWHHGPTEACRQKINEGITFYGNS